MRGSGPLRGRPRDPQPDVCADLDDDDGADGADGDAHDQPHDQPLRYLEFEIFSRVLFAFAFAFLVDILAAIVRLFNTDFRRLSELDALDADQASRCKVGPALDLGDFQSILVFARAVGTTDVDMRSLGGRGRNESAGSRQLPGHPIQGARVRNRCPRSNQM